MDQRILEIVGGDASKYPRHLEERFKRVLDKIVSLWGKPALDAEFTDLLIDMRGGRQGFPPEIMSELFVLYSAHEKHKAKGVGAWDLEEIKRGLIKENVEFTPGGFFNAAKMDNDRAVNLFLRAGYDANLENDQGWTPLMIAAFFGNEKAAAALIAAGAKVNAKDRQGYSPLHWAALQGYLAVVERLMAKGAMVNARSNRGITPLLQAAAKGHTKVVAALIDGRAWVNQSDDEGWAPLHKAVANRHTNIAALLLKAGADKDQKHRDGLSAVDIARQKGAYDILSLMGFASLPHQATA